MTNLKPCPFCGGRAELIFDYAVEGFIDAIACQKCPAAVFTLHNWEKEEKLKQFLVESWNKRVESPHD